MFRLSLSSPRKVNFDLGALVAKFWKLMNQKVKNPNKKCVVISRGGLKMAFQSALTFHLSLFSGLQGLNSRHDRSCNI